jgi:Na+/H+ antiporter NhaD/arsenite permease-like protein
MMLPFGLLLLAIALAPLFGHWWVRHHSKLVASLSLVVFAYYIFGLDDWERIGGTARDYLSFIILIGALYVVSGGIHITVKGQATPGRNVLFLFVGALIANVLGTTGASILLIYPWLRMNKNHFAGYHVAFFIFIVSNVGGCLTPISDPPLFIGYLLGVPFWWVATHGFAIWATGLGILLLMFFGLDSYYFRRAGKVPLDEAAASENWRFDGLKNLFFLAVILGAVFIDNPPFIREAIMLGAAVASYCSTPKAVHESNEFTLHPIKEVAILFLGIFATMMPALDWLEAHAASLNSPSLGFFYAGSGGLSSILDSAPTYYCFAQTLFGRFVPVGALAPGVGATDHARMAILLGDAKLSPYILAVSVGSVFFGAATYLGNGPNLIIKAIVEHKKIRAPGFLEFIYKYALPWLGPMLVVVWLLFFR